jgi:hypothetical protein
MQVEHAGKGMLVPTFAQDDAGLLVTIGTFQAHPPTVDGLGLLGRLQRGRDVPGLLLARIPDGEQADGHLVLFGVVGLRAPDALARSEAKHLLGFAGSGQVGGKRLWQSDVGLGVEANGEGSVVLDEPAQQCRSGKAAIGHDHAQQRRGSQSQDVVDEVLLELVLTVELDHGSGSGVAGLAPTGSRGQLERRGPGGFGGEAGFEFVAVVGGQGDRQAPTTAGDRDDQEREGLEVDGVEQEWQELLAIARGWQLITETVGQAQPAQVQRWLIEAGIVEETVDAFEPTVEFLGALGCKLRRGSRPGAGIIVGQARSMP